MPDEVLLIVVGITASILALILLIVLGIMKFRHRYIEPELMLKPVRANLNRMRLFIIGGIWRMKILTARKSGVSSHSRLASLPEGIEVIKKNTTRPLASSNASCPNCGNFVRFSASFCSNCGFSFTNPKTSLIRSNSLLSESPESVGLTSTSVLVTTRSKELEEEAAEIVHIDLKAQTKLYLLWDRAGR